MLGKEIKTAPDSTTARRLKEGRRAASSSMLDYLKLMALPEASLICSDQTLRTMLLTLSGRGAILSTNLVRSRICPPLRNALTAWGGRCSGTR